MKSNSKNKPTRAGPARNPGTPRPGARRHGKGTSNQTTTWSNRLLASPWPGGGPGKNTVSRLQTRPGSCAGHLTPIALNTHASEHRDACWVQQCDFDKLHPRKKPQSCWDTVNEETKSLMWLNKWKGKVWSNSNQNIPTQIGSRLLKRKEKTKKIIFKNWKSLPACLPACLHWPPPRLPLPILSPSVLQNYITWRSVQQHLITLRNPKQRPWRHSFSRHLNFANIFSRSFASAVRYCTGKFRKDKLGKFFKELDLKPWVMRTQWLSDSVSRLPLHWPGPGKSSCSVIIIIICRLNQAATATAAEAFAAAASLFSFGHCGWVWVGCCWEWWPGRPKCGCHTPMLTLSLIGLRLSLIGLVLLLKLLLFKVRVQLRRLRTFRSLSRRILLQLLLRLRHAH